MRAFLCYSSVPKIIVPFGSSSHLRLLVHLAAVLGDIYGKYILLGLNLVVNIL